MADADLPSRAAGLSPRVWVMMGHRAGDNTQVRALAEPLGWPFEIKTFAYHKWELATNVLLGDTLAGVKREQSSPLEPPWPDLIITAGRRNEPICRWIQKQADRRIRVVHVGRSWAPIECFDLIITTPQYRVPALPNVLRNFLPLHSVTPERLAKEANIWRPRFRHLPSPYTLVVIGGNSGPYTFDAKSARRLGEQANDLALETGGSILATTSARTEPAATDAFEAALGVPAEIYRWHKHATENPYLGMLGLAQSIIVTGDSVSMLGEATATGMPVYIYDIGDGPTSMRLEAGARTGRAPGPSFWQRLKNGEVEKDHWKAFVYWQTMKFGPARLTRDIRIVHQNLIAAEQAVWLGETFPEDHEVKPIADLTDAVDRIRALFDTADGSHSSSAGDRVSLP